MTGVTSGGGTCYPSGAHDYTPVFSGVCVDRSLIFCGSGINVSVNTTVPWAVYKSR